MAHIHRGNDTEKYVGQVILCKDPLEIFSLAFLFLVGTMVRKAHRKPQAYWSFLRSLAVALCIVSCANTGCSKAQQQPTTDAAYGERQSDPEVAPSTVRADSQRAQRDFDRATDAWRQGDYADAQHLFEDFLQSYPEDSLAPTAELWLVRTYLSRGEHGASRRALEDLSARASTPGVRDTAEVYLAFIDQLEGDKSGARARVRSLLERRPDVHVVDGIAPDADTPLMAALLADTRLREGDFHGALQDLEVVERTSTDAAMRSWAVSSAMTVTGRVLDRDALDALLDAESSFQRAVAIGPRIRQELDDGSVEGAAAIFQHAGPALLMHDLETDYAALQNTLALSGAVDTPMFGLAVSLQGADRQAGRAALRGMFLAQRSFEPRPRTMDVLIEDTLGTREGAQAAVEALCARGVPLIIGPVERALVPIVEEGARACGALYIGLETLQHKDADHIRMSLDAAAEARALLAHAQEQGDRTVALVTQEPSAAFFDEWVDAVKEAAQHHGITVVERVAVETEDLQKSSERAAKRLRSTDADAILFAVSDTTMTALSSYLAAQNVWPRDGARGRGPSYLASSFAWSSTLALNSGRYVQGMVVASWLAPVHARAEAFMSSYEHIFDASAGVMEAFAFDAANFARILLLDVGARDGQSMERALREGFTYRGATGEWTWNASHQDHAPTLVRIDEGQPQRL